MSDTQQQDPLSPEVVSKMLSDLEADLQAPKGSLQTLAYQDDWSLIIKGHALVEGSVSFMLAEHLDPRLRLVFSRLELGRQQTGKLEFAKALNLLEPDDIAFIKKLSTLRNSLAHDVRYLDFSINEYVAALDHKQRSNFLDSLVPDNVDPSNKLGYRKYVQQEPKWGIVASVTRIVLKAVSTGGISKLIKTLSSQRSDYEQLAQDQKSDTED